MPTLKSALKPRNWLRLFERGVFNRFTLNYIAGAMARSIPANQAAPIFDQHGYHLLRHNYYLPLPEQADFNHIKNSGLVGVDMNDDQALALLEILNLYKSEFNAFPADKTDDPLQFYLVNGSYMAIDGNVYYSLIRHYKPRRVVEIGSGNSTILAATAIRKNLAEGGSETELISIEPYPNERLKQIPEVKRLIVDKVQNIGLDFFAELQAGDILFIDSTHTVRPGGDVWWEYCEILPRLAPGVLVHVHDVSLPEPYPSVYLTNYWYWMEQYLLQAFLTYNQRFEVLWPGNYLMTKYPDQMKAAFSPEYELMRAKYPASGPSAFWMKVKEA